MTVSERRKWRQHKYMGQLLMVHLFQLARLNNLPFDLQMGWLADEDAIVLSKLLVTYSEKHSAQLLVYAYPSSAEP